MPPLTSSPPLLPRLYLSVLCNKIIKEDSALHCGRQRSPQTLDTRIAVYRTGQSPLKKTSEDYSGLLFSTAVRFVWRIAPKHHMTMTDSRPTLGGFRRPLCLLGVCGLVNHLHFPFGCFPYTPVLRRRAVLAREEHDPTILLGNSFGDRGTRTTPSNLVFRGAEV